MSSTATAFAPDLHTFRSNVLAFVGRCAPSDGVFDEAAWEASGEPSITTPGSARFVKPPEARRVVTKTLDQGMADNDWAFASTPGGVESLEGGHSAVEALHLLGQLQRLGPEHRAAWTDYFNQYHDEATGYFLGPYIPPADHPSWRDPKACTHPWDHMHDHLVASLCPTMMLLGGRARYRLSRGSQTGRFLDRDYLRHFLHGRDWTGYRGDGNHRAHNPWYLGNEYWYPACILWQITQWEPGTAEARQARRMLDDVWYEWHDRNFSTCGYWIGDLPAQGGDPARLYRGQLQRTGEQPVAWDTPARRHWAGQALMGGCHQLWFYDYDNHPIPDAVRRSQTDVALALQNRHTGHFGLGDIDNPAEFCNNCTDVDCMTVLAMNHHRQDYRRDEIEAAMERAARAILTDRVNAEGVLESQPGRPFTHNFNSVPTLSPAGAGNVLNQSFYLWAIVAACSVVRRSDDPGLQTFLDHDWPRVPSHWLHVPPRSKR